MFTRIVRILSLGLLIALLTSCASAAQSGLKQLTAKDAGSTVELRIGDNLEVALAGNPTTGYTWEVSPAADALVEQQGEPQFKADSNALGAGGIMTLKFKAVKEGAASLKLIYHRTFEPNVPPLQTFEAKLIVAQ